MSDPGVFDVDPVQLRSTAGSIGIEAGNLKSGLSSFKTEARKLHAGQGWLDSYNDVIQSILRTTEDAIDAFDALQKHLDVRTTNLVKTADNYQKLQEALRKRFAGLGGDV